MQSVGSLINDFGSSYGIMKWRSGRETRLCDMSYLFLDDICVVECYHNGWLISDILLGIDSSSRENLVLVVVIG